MLSHYSGNMHGKKYDDTKKEIRSVLLTYQSCVALDEFLKTYRGLIGQRLPSRELGFSTDVAFLKSMPDVVDFQTDSHGKIFLNGIADKSSQHIQKLVSRQRKSKTSSKKCPQFDSRQPLRKLSNRFPVTRDLKPFLPGALRVEILELMNSYENGITLSSFALAYSRKFKKFLPLTKGINSLETMIKLIPDLEIAKNDDNQLTVYHKKYLCYAERSKGSSRMVESPSEETTGKNAIQEISSPGIHESGIPDDVLKDFKMVLQKYPDGIQNIHFPPLYEQLTKKIFDVLELGYSSIADLVEALPHVFKRVPNPDDEQCWLIYPSGSHVKRNIAAKIDTDNRSKQNFHHHQERIPADVSPPTLQYIQSTIPDYINLNEYIPVFVSAISSPSLFWFQLQTHDFIEKIDKLESDMGNFYSSVGYKYKMDSADIAIGATCVIQCPDDDQYYRAVIRAIPSSELINVSFVDYGSRDNVPRENLYYVWSKFHEYPAYAFQARLGGLKPINNADSWSSQARKRFVELCNCATLMAFIKPLDKDNYSVNLCDTNGDEDIHVYDTLIYEGYAESFHQNQFNSNSSDPENFPDNHNVPVDSDSGFTSNQDMLQSDNSDALSESNELPVNRKLSFSTEVDDNAVHLNYSHHSLESSFKRYVKQIEICEGSKIHLINVKNQLFMSCDELCGLLWSEKNTNFLTRRLLAKEVDIPFIRIKEEDCIELFKQCLWYKIPGFEKKESRNSSHLLCPLKEAFNVLNIFGHPSVCLRVIIQHEIKIFDPCDEFWNEFSYDESPGLNATETDILEEINKLCLYDLKTKCEALKIQKLKLLRNQISPQSKEIRRIANLLTIITRRMKLIEAICTQYSSCS